jgi:hypothetical protein
MKITFKEFSRAYAEEYYFVIINQKRLIKKPTTPIKFATKSFIGYLVYSSFFTIAGIILTIFVHEYLPLLFIPVLTSVATIHTYYRIYTNVKKLEKSDTSSFILNLTEKQIAYGKDKDHGAVIKWDEIKKIILTENSIIFLPNAIDIFPIVVPISAKKDVQKMLKKLNID